MGSRLAARGAIHRSWWLSQSLLLLLCSWLIGGQALQAQSTAPFSLADYQQALLEWQTLLTQADGATRVSTVQQEMAAIEQVALPSGALVTLQPLLGTPDDAPPDLGVAQERLATLIDELNAASTDETAVRLALLRDIFQRPEFVERDSLWDRFWRWLRSWLPEWQPNPNDNNSLSVLFVWLGWGLVAVAASLLIWLLSYWLQTLLRNWIGGAEFAATRAGEALPPTASAARATAHTLADAGSYREAVRYLYLSALLTLYERGLITYQPSDTNHEVLRAIRHQPRLYQQLQPVVKIFDDVWYGVHEPDRTSFDNYVTAIKQLEEAT